MNVGQAITEAMRDQRKRDWLHAIGGGWGRDNIVWLQRYLWWGWDVCGPGGIGKPGVET